MQDRLIGMIGGGSWATALVKVLNENKHTVKWWIRNPQTITHLKTRHHNPHYISSIEFTPELIQPVNDLMEVIESCAVIFLAVPSAYVGNVLKNLEPGSLAGKFIISAIKGMIPDENLLIAQYLEQHFDIPFENIAVISGPSHAEEVALEKLTYLTLASPDQKKAKLACALLSCSYVQCNPSDDILGTEYAAVLKNIYAIASGIYHGLGYGDNFHAVLLSNCVGEMERFVKAVYPITRDIMDSAYLGDLLVTAYSQFSRNRTLGTMIGKGYSVRNALLEMKMVAEGYYASKCIHEVNEGYGVPIPVAEATYRVLHLNTDAAHEMKQLTSLLQ